MEQFATRTVYNSLPLTLSNTNLKIISLDNDVHHPEKSQKANSVILATFTCVKNYLLTLLHGNSAAEYGTCKFM